jgi:hypothetical protein
MNLPYRRGAENAEEARRWRQNALSSLFLYAKSQRFQRLSGALSITFLLLFGIFLSGCKSSSSAPHTRNLPQVDKVELLKLKKQGDAWTGEIAGRKSVVRDEAERVAQLWRKQTFVSDSPICHTPGYAVKFYNRDKLLVYATLCWDCNNIEFLTPKLEKYVGFDGRGAKGQELLKYLQNTFADGG